jgi:hypothetical protein
VATSKQRENSSSSQLSISRANAVRLLPCKRELQLKGGTPINRAVLLVARMIGATRDLRGRQRREGSGGGVLRVPSRPRARLKPASQPRSRPRF